MGIETIKRFLPRSTVCILYYNHNRETGTLENATAVTIVIIDPSGDEDVEETSMGGPTSTGIYEYTYNTDATTEKGQWRGIVYAVDGTGDSAKTTPVPFTFDIY